MYQGKAVARVAASLNAIWTQAERRLLLTFRLRNVFGNSAGVGGFLTRMRVGA